MRALFAAVLSLSPLALANGLGIENPMLPQAPTDAVRQINSAPADGGTRAMDALVVKLSHGV